MATKKAPTNTTEEMRTPGGSAGFMLDAMLSRDGRGGAIERQEARGQSELVESDVLPVDTHNKPEEFEKIGVKLGEPVPGDPLFRYAILPPGWKKVPTDHAMHSKVIDEKGRERIAIFYKAAFYDRSANMGLVPRFRVNSDYVKAGTAERYEWDKVDADAIATASDGATFLFTTPPFEYVRGGKGNPEASEKARKAAADWLAERYPNFRDPTAHWEEP